MKINGAGMVFFALSAFLAAACGGSAHVVKSKWKPGPMPAAGNFDGVYGSDFGRLEITVSGDAAIGLYEADKHYGRLEGKVDGDLLHFSWTQWNEDMQGKLRETTGRGVFRYIVTTQTMGDRVDEEHSLDGTWGYGASEAGNSWRANKNPRANKQLQPREQAKTEMQTGPAYQESVGFESTETKTNVDVKPKDEPKNTQDAGPNLDGLF
jgi:hypothetical protein